MHSFAPWEARTSVRGSVVLGARLRRIGALTVAGLGYTELSLRWLWGGSMFSLRKTLVLIGAVVGASLSVSLLWADGAPTMVD